ncbi:hypothetical protein JMJ77_0009465 [Colletotrichum scovillei]|uniref:Uncharacterized protein n=1 Tax=Colletotrichum scovillei TaxID=1209932 RepID=A0A9P7QZZ9_9PEZI|nr:hypothetical protein JMJ77_0009465 [Colletotrichum scovillei]KAG7052544.1 hypothetical protein JMJ78_0005560 [Colletotrichum scovillei]KAG7064836.1 hypothetical protein JMJ76_0012594 [Colletotrichum scovillei]
MLPPATSGDRPQSEVQQGAKSGKCGSSRSSHSRKWQ